MKVYPTPDPTKVVSDVILTEPAYFDIFHYEWLVGDPSTGLGDPFKVVLSESKARDYFGAIPLSEMIGRVITYNDSLRLAISGIVKDYPKNSDFVFKQFISLATINHSFLNKPPYLTSGISWIQTCSLMKTNRDSVAPAESNFFRLFVHPSKTFYEIAS